VSEILGLPQLLATFARFQVEAEAGEEIAERAGAAVVAADMRAKAPVDTGALRNSITVSSAEEGAQVAATVPYARFVQFGTRYMEAQPFISDEVQSPVLSVMTKVFQGILR
jgi:HK97 gp10 family phage protein